MHFYTGLFRSTVCHSVWTTCTWWPPAAQRQFMSSDSLSLPRRSEDLAHISIHCWTLWYQRDVFSFLIFPFPSLHSLPPFCFLFFPPSLPPFLSLFLSLFIFAPFPLLLFLFSSLSPSLPHSPLPPSLTPFLPPSLTPPFLRPAEEQQGWMSYIGKAFTSPVNYLPAHVSIWRQQ